MLDHPPVLGRHGRRHPAGLDVDDAHRAAAPLERPLGDLVAGEDGSAAPVAIPACRVGGVGDWLEESAVPSLEWG